MMMRNRLKARIAAGETVTGAWLELGTPEVAEILVRTGWDVIVIDCEHGVADLEEGFNLVRAVEAAGGEAVMRVPDGADTTLKRALDRGVRSLMVPMVNSAERARAVAHSCLYPPRGGRGYAAPIVRASGYGALPGYAANAHQELFLMVQIETAQAVAELDAILAVEGIDMAFVGPNDLAGSLGFFEQLEHPRVQEVLGEIEARIGRVSRTFGTIEGAGRDYARLKSLGYRFIVGPNDISMLAGAARAAAAVRDAQLKHG